MRTILITGASGMLGMDLARIMSQNFRIVGTYNSRSDLPSLENVTWVNLDITSPDSVDKLKEEHVAIDAIIHCAAATDVNKCELDKDSCRKINVGGTQLIVSLAQNYEIPLIFISTPMIFDGFQGNYKEKSRPRPQNYYAQTKLLAENLVLQYRNGLVLRINPIGVRPQGAHPSFIQWFVGAARANRSLELFSDVRVNPISTATLANIIPRLLTEFKPGILHLGSRDVVSKAEIWYRVARHFPKFSGQVREISVDETKIGRIAKRPKDMWLNIEKAQDLGYVLPSWEEEVELVLKILI